jgi:hypothetical protein
MDTFIGYSVGMHARRRKKVNADKTVLVTLQYVTATWGGGMLKYKALNNNAIYSSSPWYKISGN